MRYLFSPQGESVLNRFITRDTLLAFDFDGTLAPIVPHPDSASTPTSIGLAMKRLCEIATVAIITGRSVQDIRERLGFTPKYIVGNHGAEGLPGAVSSGTKLAEVAAWESQILAARESLPSGVSLENKGHSLTLHYRMAADRESARLALENLAQTLDPLPKRIGGKCVVNLLPRDAADKFDALLALQRIESAPNALFIGDDETDEHVFRRALPGWLTIRVGHDAPSAAAFCLNSQHEMVTFIQRIDGLIRSTRKETDR
jgi:trehalose 6-phosphate phosphatase